MKPSRVAIASSAAALTLAAGTGYLALHREGSHSGTSRVAQFSESGVIVVVNVKDRTATRASLAVTFTPDRPGFHLYSIDLPPNGIQGVGRPTSVTTQGVLHAAGPESAETTVTTLPLAGTDLTLPVYPDGPVTVDLPVTIDGAGQATVLIGYAACSPQTCLPPVSGYQIPMFVTDHAISG
ncbi:hypothetical protein [Catenulispora rubra]|uniref:hypothetical protein n=1 Tax=Catenulispora rubra TaxID=280293 RepID=UPI0018926D8D|nr:hypothetical protein [Catenulispora rubra]